MTRQWVCLSVVFLWCALPGAAHAANEQEADDAARQQFDSRFERADGNGDGVITADEMTDMPALFPQLDADADGQVTREEAWTFARRHTYRLPSLLTDIDPADPALAATAPPKPVADRFTERTFPSVFQAWCPATNLPDESACVTLARHDLAFVGPGSLGLEWDGGPMLAEAFRPEGAPVARAVRARLLSLNPNLILLMSVSYREAWWGFLPEDHEWWERDENGERVPGWGESFVLDFGRPDLQAHVARRAKAAMDTGAFDGIFLDWWIDDEERLALVKRIRLEIGEEAVILVNANDRTTPLTADYVNGYFMECWRSATREDWDRFTQSLLRGQKNVRQPALMCVETWFETSRQDLNRMRATTCLALTHSDGYCLFSDPNELPTPDHLHDWYTFWDKRLGKPVAKGVLNADGSAVREFENGTVAYNPMGNEPMTITFGNERVSLATGRTATSHVVSGLDGDIFLHPGAAEPQ